MSDKIVNELVQFIGTLAEAGIDMDGVKVVNRDAVIEILRGVIQNEWLRTGVLKKVIE